MWPDRLRRATLLAVILLYGQPVWAHSGLSISKTLWDGSLHFLASPLSLAAVTGLLAALFGIGEKQSLTASLMAGLAAGTSSVLAGSTPAYLAPAALVLLGLLALAGWKPSDVGVVLLALVAGIAGGVAADLDSPTWPGAIGVAATMTFASGAALVASQDLSAIAKLQPILPIARRVVGSWVAAIGLLMFTLAIHQGGV